MDITKLPLACIRDTPDHRDFRRYSAVAPVELPETFEVSNQPAIRSQGQTNSCTAFASAFVWEQCLKSRGMLKEITLSAHFIWFWSRWQTGDQGSDVGCQIRDVMKGLQEMGAAPEDEWPESSPHDKEPSDIAKIWGAALSMPSYERLESVYAIKVALAIENQAVVIGLPIYGAWYESSMQSNGIVPARQYLGSLVGWHAMAVTGYTKERAILAGSWGDRYGAKGYVFVPWEYLDYEKTSELPGFDAWCAGKDIPKVFTPAPML